jgi:hypothetical protein
LKLIYPYLFGVCLDGLLRRCVSVEKGIKIIKKIYHSAPYGGHYGAFHTHAKIEWILLTNYV